MPRAAPRMVALLVLLTSGCAAATAEATTPATASADPRSGPSAPSAAQLAPPVSFPECQAEEFEFAGIGTFRGLGLHNATPVPPPDIDRKAKIWVTRDLMPHDFGPPGGPVQMTRMLCFEFADGSGGSGWPVDSTWRPP